MSGRPERVHLPESELRWRFSRSSGPGGQHVNTSDTRVEVRWSVADTTALSPGQRERVAAALRPRMVDGAVVVTSSQYRSQHRNREAARVRLEELVAAALAPRRPRRATRPTRGSERRRRAAKEQRSQRKAARRERFD